MKLTIVVLDGQLANPGDLSWLPIKRHGKLVIYNATDDADIIERASEADILITNKVRLNKDHFNHLPTLKLICLLATGYDNINLEDAKRAGIIICNALGYAVHSVAQHTFALLLDCYNKVALHNDSVQNGDWSDRQWSYSLSTLRELNAKTIGIYGFGKIGRRVSVIAMAFGMKVLAHHKYPERDKTEDVRFVTLEELFEQSDVITLHAPLSGNNNKIINAALLNKTKHGFVLINSGRGGLIDELDLRDFLSSRKDASAALDVLAEEPPRADHPLTGLDNCIITPHNAWAAKESRARLLDIVGDNIEAYINGDPINVIRF